MKQIYTKKQLKKIVDILLEEGEFAVNVGIGLEFENDEPILVFESVYGTEDDPFGFESPTLTHRTKKIYVKTDGSTASVVNKEEKLNTNKGTTIEEVEKEIKASKERRQNTFKRIKERQEKVREWNADKICKTCGHLDDSKGLIHKLDM